MTLPKGKVPFLCDCLQQATDKRQVHSKSDVIGIYCVIGTLKTETQKSAIKL